jgi:predicted nucleic acid-binding protein
MFHHMQVKYDGDIFRTVVVDVLLSIVLLSLHIHMPLPDHASLYFEGLIQAGASFDAECVDDLDFDDLEATLERDPYNDPFSCWKIMPGFWSPSNKALIYSVYKPPVW